MNKTEIIPAIDIIEGKCVRLTKGDYSTQKVYNTDPLEVAKSFEDVGIRFLHLVDLDGAKAHHIVNARVLEKIAGQTRLIIDFGGGLKSDEDVKIAFESGASMITGGSIAVKNPSVFESWITTYGAEKIILGADAMHGMIAVSGWQEDSGLELIPFVRSYIDKGIRRVICTDISRDGMLQGAANVLYEKMIKELPSFDLVASGGISSMQDILDLQHTGVAAAITGKAIYEGHIKLEEIAKYNLQ